jgi:hypothetical protein
VQVPAAVGLFAEHHLGAATIGDNVVGTVEPVRSGVGG